MTVTYYFQNVMVDIEDRRSADEIPYRLVSGGWDINSLQYHRAVYLCIQGKFEGHIKLDDKNNHDLFMSRRKMGWRKIDSLYEAWLLANFNECRGSFNRDLFTR